MNAPRFGEEGHYLINAESFFVLSCSATISIYLHLSVLGFLFSEAVALVLYLACLAMAFAADVENKKWTKIFYGPIHWTTRFFIFYYYRVKFDITGRV